MVGGDPVTGEGSPSSPASFGRLLGAAAQPGEWIRISVGGEAFGGTVVAVSAEVAVMRLDNGDLTYVNLDAVEEASLANAAADRRHLARPPPSASARAGGRPPGTMTAMRREEHRKG